MDEITLIVTFCMTAFRVSELVVCMIAFSDSKDFVCLLLMTVNPFCIVFNVNHFLSLVLVMVNRKPPVIGLFCVLCSLVLHNIMIENHGSFVTLLRQFFHLQRRHQ